MDPSAEVEKEFDELLMYYAFGGEYDSFKRLEQFVASHPQLRNEMPVYVATVFIKSGPLHGDHNLFKDMTATCHKLGIKPDYSTWIDPNQARVFRALHARSVR